MLTPDDVATLLRVDRSRIVGLLERGELAGLRVAGEWRVPQVAVEDFLRRGIDTARQEGLARTLTDPREWTEEIRRMPGYAEWLAGQEFEEGTMGAWLQGALRAEEAIRKADNVVPIDRRD